MKSHSPITLVPSTFRRFRFHLIFFTSFLFIIFSCENDKEKTTDYDHLISVSRVKSQSASQIKNTLSTIIGIYPDIQQLIDNTSYNVDIYKIVYNTTFKEEEVEASGLVCVPRGEKEFPLLSFQNGTNTQWSNAPSVNLLNPNYTLIEGLAGNGYIITIPDYLGFGVSNDILHPYIHQKSNNDVVIDLLEATKEALQHNLLPANTSDSLYLMGYSQGGWSTLSVLYKLENSPSNPFHLVAASCGAGPYNLLDVTEYIISQETYPAPFYLPYFIESHIRNELYSSTLSTFFKEPYASNIPELFNGLNSNSQISKQLTDTVKNLLTDDLRLNFGNEGSFTRLKSYLDDNSITAWNTTASILLTHGSADKNIPSEISSKIYLDFISISVAIPDVSLVLLPDLNHETALIPWGINSLIWFNQFN